jgi:hypothetical protein
MNDRVNRIFDEAYKPELFIDSGRQAVLMKEIYAELRSKEEEVFKGVMRQVLGREATEADAKECTKLYKSDIDQINYWLVYKGITLGKVTFSFDGPKWGITFEPDPKYK